MATMSLPSADAASAMGMSDADCPAARHDAVFEGGGHDGSCNHPFVLVVNNSASSSDCVVIPRWTLVETLPLPALLSPSQRTTTKAPPVPQAAIDPVFLAFRV